MQENNRNHIVTIEQKKNIYVSGVESVLGFSEMKILLALLDGGKLTVLGSELKIVGFSKTEGKFSAEGSVSGVSYGAKSLASKLFK